LLEPCVSQEASTVLRGGAVVTLCGYPTLSSVVLLFLLITASGPNPVTGKNSLVTFTAKLTVKPGREQAFEITVRGVVP
jgi:hypothetical protein